MKLRENQHQRKNQLPIFNSSVFDQYILKNKKTKKRKNYVKNTVIAGLTIASLITGMKCSNPTTPDIPVSPVPVTLQFDVYNHTQGLQASFTKNNVTSETSVILNIADIMSTYGVTGVDNRRIAIRQGNFGGLIVFSRTGEASFTAPRQNTDYDIYLMNTSGMTKNRHYQKVDDWIDKGAGILGVPRNASWHREDRDGYTGKKSIITSAVSQLNNAINYSWAKYGSLNKVGSNGDFGVGYGYCNNWAGMHSSDWAGVNPDNCFNERGQLKVFLAEIFELTTRTDDLDGISTYGLICNRSTGNLNEIGRELFAYVYVKDSKTAGSGSKNRFSIGFH